MLNVRIIFSIALTSALALSGCSSRALAPHGAPIGVQSNIRPATPTSALPRPWVEGMPLRPDSTKRINLPEHPYHDRIAELRAAGMLLRRGPTLRAPRPLNTLTKTDSGGQGGINIVVNNVQGGYAGQQVSAGYYSGRNDALYAPTMRPGDPSCLEGSVVYDHVHSEYFVGFYAFCGTANTSGFYGKKPINDPGFAQYTTAYNGHKIVSLEVRFFQSDQKWHGLLYNYSTAGYEDVFSTGGSCGPGPTYARQDTPGGCNLSGGTPNGGWDMFETHYYNAGSACPTIPSVESDALQTQDANGRWTLASAASSLFYQYGECADASGTTYPYDAFTEGSNGINGYVWRMTQGGSRPTATPRRPPATY